jgi:uncharacterized protein (DUF3820 family)
MDKQTFIDSINSKGLRNSLISIWYNIGRALPFRAQRFPDGRVSDWYKSQFVEVHKVKPSGKGGQYGDAYGFYYRNGKRENNEWCKIEDITPQSIPCGACGSWVLLDILGEPTATPTKIYGLNDILEFGKHKGELLIDVIHNDWRWVEWAIEESQHFFCDVNAVIGERKKVIKKLYPDDVITFGKYKGKTIKQIFENDSNYILWLIENSKDLIIDLDELVSSTKSNTL